MLIILSVALAVAVVALGFCIYLLLDAQKSLKTHKTYLQGLQDVVAAQTGLIASQGDTLAAQAEVIAWEDTQKTEIVKRLDTVIWERNAAHMMLETVLKTEQETPKKTKKG